MNFQLSCLSSYAFLLAILVLAGGFHAFVVIQRVKAKRLARIRLRPDADVGEHCGVSPAMLVCLLPAPLHGTAASL